MSRRSFYCRFKRLFKNRAMKECLDHQFFKNMNYWRKIQINSLEIESPAKRKVMILFLNIKFDTFEKVMCEFVSSPDCLKNLNLVEGIIIDAIKTYEEEALRNGIPEIVLTKFNEWHKDTIEDTVSLLRTILESGSHTDNFNQLIAILDILTFAFRKTILHAEDTMNGLNGQLEAALKGTQFDN